jgi:hypothetical protein
MYSSSDRLSGCGAESSPARRRSAGSSHTESEDSTRAIADFYRTTGQPTASGNDPRRRAIGSGKAFETATFASSDAGVASGANRRPQFLAVAARVSASFYAALRKSRGSGGSKWRAPADPAPPGQTLDAGERVA